MTTTTFLYAAVRAPTGRYGGAFAGVRPHDHAAEDQAADDAGRRGPGRR